MNAIEKLEETKININNAIIDSFAVNHYNDSPFADDDDYDLFAEIDKVVKQKDLYKECRVIIRKIAKEREVIFPKFIQGSRTIDEVVTYLSNEMNSDDTQSTLTSKVTACFNEFIDYLEEEQLDVKIVHVECEVPTELTFYHILESIKKCESRIKDEDYSGAVTSAKTLVEGVCKEILLKFPDVTIDNKTDLLGLFKKVRQKLNLDPSDLKLEKSLQEVLTGLIKVVSGITEIRNMHGDAHVPKPKYKIDRHHALLVVNSAKTVVTFLFNTYEYQLERGTLLKA